MFDIVLPFCYRLFCKYQLALSSPTSQLPLKIRTPFFGRIYFLSVVFGSRSQGPEDQDTIDVKTCLTMLNKAVKLTRARLVAL